MPRKSSTFERKMKNPKFRKAFEIGYKKLLFSELMIAIMENDDVSIRKLAKEADIAPSIIQKLRSGEQTDIKVSNLIKIAHVFHYSVVLERGDERLVLHETKTKDLKKHLSVVSEAA